MRARALAGAVTALLVAVSGVTAGPVEARERSCTRAPLTERAGQLLVVGLPGVTRASQPLARRIIDVGVGGVFLDGTANVRSSAQVRRLVAGLRRRVTRPLLAATDEEGGRVSDFRELLGVSPSAR
ncbi:MAG: hypothetical protein M3N17_03845, partial [Actinomycetota bacterium]|nr:hypothetical protein [Actinomycetota bacterium]